MRTSCRSNEVNAWRRLALRVLGSVLVATLSGMLLPPALAGHVPATSCDVEVVLRQGDRPAPASPEGAAPGR